MERLMKTVWAALLGCCVAGCSGLGENPNARPENPSDVTQMADYRLGTGDRIRVKVYGVEQIGGEAEVDIVGDIDTPLIGRVHATGRTPAQLSQDITTRLKQNKIVEDPQVSVELMAPHPFYVLGEVEKSGEYPYRAGMNVVSAVATAGGYRYRANQDKVYILRRGQTVEVVVPTSLAVAVYPGDIVRVPGRVF
jgi:polysaccharide export outer membrane protein